MDMPQINQTTSIITGADRWDHVLARCGFKRMQHRVQSGLYELGSPNKESPVFVTANYTLSFDALRAALNGQNAFILVLDTKGINVWCAAGKGTFGTDELISKVRSTGLANVVNHHHLILPQLGATGVSAHTVKQECGFEVEYGPVRAEDLPEYLNTHQATAEMRKTRFNLIDRLTLVPLEVVNSFIPMVLIASILYLPGGGFNLLWVFTAWLVASVLFLVLLPWIPTREFSTKGLILGIIVALPFVIYQISLPDQSIIQSFMRVIPTGLILTSLISYFTLNLTGTTPITSWTSVRQEIFRYIPVFAIMAGSGIILTVMRAFGLGK
jgi:hypothetical protein